MIESASPHSRAQSAVLGVLVLSLLLAPAGANLSYVSVGSYQLAAIEHTRTSAPIASTAGKLTSVSQLSATFPPRKAAAFYPAGQDPMGLADYGQAHYDTKSFLASVSIASLSTLGSGSVGSDMTFQLNVNLGFEDGGNWYVYWIQDVAELDTSNNYIYFIDNVWNSSGPSGSVYSSTLAGNGQFGTYSGQQYYYDVASGSLQGNGVYLTYPSTFDMIANTTINGNGQPVVDFTYQNGGSWITYDRVTFSFVSHLDYSDNFLVTSATPNPAGLGYDAEIVLGGPGGGSNTNDQSSNVQLTLQYWNGNNYQMIQNGENHGEDTGETITNAEVNGYYYASTGQLYAGVIAGTENIDQLWGSTTIAFVNLQGPGTCDGTLFSGSSGTPYIGGNASITLWPVSPDFQVSCDAFTLNLGTYSLSAGSTLDLAAGTWANLGFGENGLSGESTWSVTIGSDVHAGSGTVLNFYVPVGSYQYTVSGPAHYLPQPSTGALTLSSAGAGVSVTWQEVQVSTNSTSGSVDLGQVVEFSTSLTGTTGDSFAWSGLPTGCSGIDSFDISCRATGAGASSVAVAVTDANGYTATSAASSFTVYVDPSISAPAAPVTSSDVGQSVTFSTIVTPGSGGDTFTWLGLPLGCASADAASVACVPSAKGTYTVEITLTDSNGFTVRAAELLTVYPLPTVDSFTVNPGTTILVGQSLTFTVIVGNGSGGYHYSWTGLPSGCQSTDSSSLSCTPTEPGSWNVSVLVTDSDGGTATSQGVAVSVQPSFLGLPALEGYALFIVLPIVVVIALIAVYAARRRRHGTSGTESNPGSPGPVEPIPVAPSTAGPTAAGSVPEGVLLGGARFEQPSSAAEGLDPGSVAMGTPLIDPPNTVCWKCNFHNEPGSRYCAQCAVPLEPPPSR
jgi:hypothetical protein